MAQSRDVPTINPLNQDSIEDAYDDSLELAHKHSHALSFTLDYTSKVVFRGRDFGKKQYGFTPNIKYKNPSGFYATMNNYLWSGISEPIAKTDLGVGYEKELGKHLNLDISYERWFFANDSFFDPRALNNMLELELGTDFDKLNVQFGGFYIWGNDQALLLDVTTDYRIDVYSIFKKLNIAIDPSLLFEFFSGANSISVNTVLPRRRANNLVANLAVANYEFFLPVEIKHKNFTFTPSYHFAYPIAISHEDPPLSPYLKGGFSYFTITAQYDLYISKKHGKHK